MCLLQLPEITDIKNTCASFSFFKNKKKKLLVGMFITDSYPRKEVKNKIPRVLSYFGYLGKTKEVLV